MADLSPADPKGHGIAVSGGVDILNDAETCMGGQGLYGAGSDVIKVLGSLAANDGKILKPETVEMMFQSQLSDSARKSMRELMRTELGHTYYGCNTPIEKERDYGFDGLLLVEGVDGWFGNNTMQWGGGINSAWVSTWPLKAVLGNNASRKGADNWNSLLIERTGFAGLSLRNSYCRLTLRSQRV